ncbi:MAG: protein translocase subunit SecD [Spirochaetales bacterium]|nr:protein translocase subunit SecD [Spirochaetales bacterium]
MSKRSRLFIILLVVAVCGAFLYSTFNWYFLIPEEKRELSAGSREQIREYAIKKSSQVLKTLQELALTEPEAQLPEEYAFLKDKAKEYYKSADRSFPETWTVTAVLSAFTTREEAAEILETHYREELLGLKEYQGKILQLGLDLSGGMSITLQADMDSLQERLERTPTRDERDQALDQVMEILNNRIDRFGVTEPSIRRQGDDEILIEIPGAADPDRVNSFLMGKGSLKFHIVDDAATETWNAYKQGKTGILVDKNGKPLDPEVLDAGRIVRGFYTKDDYGVDTYVRDLVINQEPGLDGNHIVEAQVGNDPVTGRPVVNFILDREGGEIFFQLTSAHVEDTLAIVLDDKIKAGARISEPIRESVRMNGFDRKDATDLATVLRTAAMPVELVVNNQQSIGASLGEDSIRQGLRAIGLGFICVVFFMALYYRRSGIVADIALILNLFFIVAILSAFNLTLTLTSIAGLILTVGMAVDANVIIFERIKEEHRLGKTPAASIKAGYRKAFQTIMDANITTFIAAIFLSQLGTGPIQGFAYTLAVGIVSSMFTALFITRLIFDFGLDVLHTSKLRIGWRVR